MATQSESNPRSGEGSVEKPSSQSTSGQGRGTDVAPEVVPPERFSADDPQRSESIAAIDGEAGAFLSRVGLRATRPEELAPSEWRALQGYAAERERWNAATSDVFSGILRLGNTVPPRSKRVL